LAVVTAKELSELVGLSDNPTVMGHTNLINLTHNEGKTVYINEAGLYKLNLTYSLY